MQNKSETPAKINELPRRKRTGYLQGIIFIFRRKRRGIKPKEIKHNSLKDIQIWEPVLQIPQC
jgi:hypothetical protein